MANVTPTVLLVTRDPQVRFVTSTLQAEGISSRSVSTIRELQRALGGPKSRSVAVLDGELLAPRVGGHEPAVDAGLDPVLVGTPEGEGRKVFEDFARVGVEDVRAVAVDEDAGIVVAVVGVSADVRAAVERLGACAGLTRAPRRILLGDLMSA